MLAFDGIAEWLVVLPILALFIRAVPAWRSALDAVCRPVAAAVVLAGLWGLVTLAWSSDRANGLDELSTLRHALLILALWPLRDHRGVLIAALAIGFALGHLTQIGHAIGVWGDVAWLRWPRLPDRNSGWWDPVVGGSLLTAAVGLHLPAAMWGRGGARWIGVAGASAALGGLVATGTRGAWIACALLLVIAGVCAGLAWVRRARRDAASRRVSRGAWAALAAAACAIVVAAVAAGPEVIGRAGRGLDEVRRAIDAGDYTSDTGRRLFMWMESWAAFKAHPIGGVGAGGLNDWAEAAAAARGMDPSLVLPHAHGMWVHLAATQGVVGVVAWAAVVGVAMVAGATRVSRLGRVVGAGALGVGRAGSAASRGSHGGYGISNLKSQISNLIPQMADAYSLGPVFALLGLVLAGLFDTIHVNSQTAMLLFALIPLCAMGRRVAAR